MDRSKQFSQVRPRWDDSPPHQISQPGSQDSGSLQQKQPARHDSGPQPSQGWRKSRGGAMEYAAAATPTTTYGTVSLSQGAMRESDTGHRGTPYVQDSTLASSAPPKIYDRVVPLTLPLGKQYLLTGTPCLPRLVHPPVLPKPQDPRVGAAITALL